MARVADCHWRARRYRQRCALRLQAIPAEVRCGPGARLRAPPHAGARVSRAWALPARQPAGPPPDILRRADAAENPRRSWRDCDAAQISEIAVDPRSLPTCALQAH